MVDRRFRFGVIAEPEYTGAQWRAVARRAEELGYSTLLMPDGLQLLAPLPAVAVAATVTTTLRVGTFVLASTVRPPRTTAWEAHSLATLTDHRFELGIGTGNPWMNQAAVDEIGVPVTTPAQRLELVRRTVEDLRRLETARTPVMIAAGGPRARALAGQLADIVTLAHSPLAPRQDVKQMFAEIAEAAGERADQIEYNLNVPAIGDSIPPHIAPLVGDDLGALIEADSLYLLRGTPREMADEIQRRRDVFGYSYVTVNALYLEEFAPVVELLRGR
ncbi:LLM class flavin-dependent oxidoreductase [Amycolatopsis anabasis]|uniref:LLM class flavin-dependent oxidoreductase n=1 Tax=Amycolatopsis anabasis TaxID=1840409 RepID=UPI00131B6C9C|nr:LLM class flavin-dependent oxidoreductase [Amycolatopsis anabasis]